MPLCFINMFIQVIKTVLNHQTWDLSNNKCSIGWGLFRKQIWKVSKGTVTVPPVSGDLRKVPPSRQLWRRPGPQAATPTSFRGKTMGAEEREGGVQRAASRQ